MSNFIEDYWLKNAHLWSGKLITRFPPEPNGALHIGHVKAARISFELAKKFGGVCNLRMDDTNPEKESEHYVDGIKEMVSWLGFKWEGEVKYASDYFDKMCTFAKELIRNGHAYMDFSDKETTRVNRGTLTTPGVRSKDAAHPIDWHLEMFERMKSGALDEGSCVLRAKLDMASPNMNLRDPVLYRIKKVHHNRTGNTWCIYPAYDFAHPFSDYEECVSLSLCTLEFEDHRPFYDWVIERCAQIIPNPSMKHVPVELEFARLELDKGLTSKRKINALVDDGSVDGIDDPRLVTLAGLRRRGFTPDALVRFCEEAGVCKANSILPFERLEDTLRTVLDYKAPRRFVVVTPVKLDIINGPASYETTVLNHPKNESMGERTVKMGSEMWIDVHDVRAPGHSEAGFKRAEVGAVFRIMPGLVLKCLEVEVGSSGEVERVVCEPSNEKPRATIHGLSRHFAVPMEIWEPEVIANEEDEPASCLVIRHGYAEPSVATTSGTWHAVRYGYCTVDRSTPNRLILSTKLKSSI